MAKHRPSRAGKAAARAPQVGRRALTARHPLFGSLRGLLRVMPGTDLTKPADEAWGHCEVRPKTREKVTAPSAANM
jgi:hypothetical protein